MWPTIALGILGLSLELASGATLPSLPHTRVKPHDGGRPVSAQSSALTLEKPLTNQKVPLALEGVAVPFVSIDPSNQTLQLHPAALESLGRVPAPVGDGKGRQEHLAQHVRTVAAQSVGDQRSGGDARL